MPLKSASGSLFVEALIDAAENTLFAARSQRRRSSVEISFFDGLWVRRSATGRLGPFRFTPGFSLESTGQVD
jgi:hypothetical protein